MRSTLLSCALVFLTTVGLSGCKSGKIGMPRLPNPFAKSAANSTSPELPTVSATPTAPKAGFAAATAGTTVPPYTGSPGVATSADTTGSYASRSPRTSIGTTPAAGYGTPGATASTTKPYMSPQAGRYDTGGGYGSLASNPSYNSPPPLTASRTNAAPGYGSSTRDYSSVAPSSRYGNSVDPPPRYGTNWDRSSTTSPIYGTAGTPGARYGTSTDSKAYVSTGSGGYGARNASPPWNRDDRRTADLSAAAGPPSRGLSDTRGLLDSRRSTSRERALGDVGYTPGKTGYTPGATGYTPPNTPKYTTPASPYRSPLATGTGDSGYAPGSTSRWSPPTGALSEPSGTPASGTDRGYPPAGRGVTPAGFSQPTTTGLR